ncbi:cell division protein ZapA [Dehalobacter sp. DCM]|uniref:cell division protein ZapA n=1 Tax=Dehalobacter sp. DCM TaxID=2907827 RepID=UPI003081A6D0|nr:cell division protein ZapA [Dehalobacter sp. DCM]
MNPEENKVAVNILGEIHVIRGNGSEEYIKGLARDVDKRMNEISLKFPRLAAHQIGILTALNLADELARLKEEHKNLLDMLGDNGV